MKFRQIVNLAMWCNVLCAAFCVACAVFSIVNRMRSERAAQAAQAAEMTPCLSPSPTSSP